MDESLSTAKGRSILATSVFWQPQMQGDLSGRGPCEDPQVLAKGPSRIIPLGHSSACGAD